MMLLLLLFIIQIISFTLTEQVVVNSDQKQFKYYDPTPTEKLMLEDQHYWYDVAEKALKHNLDQIQEEPKQSPIAKNVILFVGDGMGISTITATRIYKGQRKFDKSGEDYSLIYEHFPHLALVKTYNVDMQVPDSAGTATAMFTGVKTNYKVVGLDVKSNKTTFDKNTYEESKIESIITWAQKANKATGIITTTRITHATPAASYAHVNFRDWECDSKIPIDVRRDDDDGCKDIARQLIEDDPGRKFNVIMGGGYQQMGFIDYNETDECVRTDKRNLTQLWLDNHKFDNAQFITNNEQLENNIDENCDYLLGLFHANHLPYELLRDKGPKGTPSLKQLLEKGLKVLKRNPNGYVVIVEGGRIDHGHHNNYARLALEESVQFEEAIRLALNQTDNDETLILVTADHSHAMTLNGYAHRGNDILGYGIEDVDNNMKPGLTLSYANGPGFSYHYQLKATPANTNVQTSSVLGPWLDVRDDVNRLIDPKYRHSATYYMDDESHGGEDVAIFAKGPGSKLIRGVIEQNYIAHVVSYSACIGPRANLNYHCKNQQSSSKGHHIFNNVNYLHPIIIIIMMIGALVTCQLF